MPDPILFLGAAAIAALVAGVVVLICGRPWRADLPDRWRVGPVLGMALGFYAGCRFLGVGLPWPLPSRDQAQDMDRFLLVLVPATILAELVAAARGRWRWLAWPLRAVIAAGAARLLLDNSSYLVDRSGPGTAEWTPDRARQILGGSGLALAAAWAAMAGLARRPQGWATPLALAFACGGAGLVVMLSGYASGGQVGVPLAASLVGVAAVALILPARVATGGAIGVGVVGLFAILVVGRFFGTLTTTNALILFFGPLLAWLPELPPRLRGVARVALVALPVALALLLAGQKFAEDSAPSSDGKKAPSDATAQDYLDFRG